MAQVKNYGLIGVGTEVQLGKQGPKVKGDADTDVVSVTTEGDALTVIRAANAVSSSDLVTKAQLDASASGSNGFELELGNISAEGDGSWTDGAVQTITNSTKISEGLDKINEAIGWEPTTKIQEGIEKTVSWYKKNEDYLKDLVYVNE